MTVSIPGALADRWLDAPGERDPQFFPVYARVSRAVQRAIRTWLPYLYFSSPERYEDLEVAAPLVVYQASRPFAGRPKYDFSYDVLRDSSMTIFYRRASGRLSEELARIEGLLLRGRSKRLGGGLQSEAGQRLAWTGSGVTRRGFARCWWPTLA